MVTCPNCGTDNDLGRVFCTQCGTKLDLSQMSSGNIETMQQETSNKKYYLIGAGVVVGLILVVTGLVLWPQSEKLGDNGSRNEGTLVKRQFNILKNMRKGMSVGPAIREKNLNGYFQHYLVKDIEATSLSVKAEKGTATFRMTRELFMVPGLNKPLVLSSDVVFKNDGKSMKVSGGALGHMPMPGPLGAIPKSMITGAVSDRKEWKYIDYLKEVSSEDGKLKFSFKK